jgi:hypothetical protein
MASQVRIRTIKPNLNSTKNQVTVQFAQQDVIDANAGGGGNRLVALAQGNSGGSGIVMALLSFNAEVAQRLFGTTDADYSKLPFDQWPTPDNLVAELGADVNIEVIENTTKNPNAPNQQPKINPATGEVQTFGGNPIYRHTQLVTGKATVSVITETDQRKAASAKPEIINLAKAHQDAFEVL